MYKALLVLLLLICIVKVKTENTVLSKFSFDSFVNPPPETYHTYGAAIIGKSKRIKLIPPVEYRYGGVFLTEKYRSNSFSLDYVFQLNSPTQVSDGFVFWYTPTLPKFDSNSGRIHGVEQDTRGFSVWLHKDERSQQGTR